MNRRDFVSRVTLGGAAAACTAFGTSAYAAPAASVLQVPLHRLDGIRRTEGSVVPGRHARSVASPRDPCAVSHGAQGLRRSPRRSGWCPCAGVIPAAFDTELVGTQSGGLRVSLAAEHLDRGDLGHDRSRRERGHADGAPGTASRRASGCAATSRSGRRRRSRCAAAGSRTRPPIRTPARRGRSAAISQQLTDAVNYRNLPGASTTIRLTSGADVQNITVRRR